ncbi:hypothetical protein BJX99DRAFT_242709 [Aspergillus californicus]
MSPNRSLGQRSGFHIFIPLLNITDEAKSSPYFNAFVSEEAWIGICYEIQGKVSTWEVDEAYIDYTHGSLLIERSNEAINDRT